MKEILVKKFECDWCKRLFEDKKDCEWHEKYFHKCPSCEHVWYLYGSEQMCELKRCNYKKKEESSK